MGKTKGQVRAYNKEYFARPEVIARAKVRNAARRAKRRAYKKTERGKAAERRSRNSARSKLRLEANRVKTRYGLSPEQHQELVRLAAGRCAICNQAKARLEIDHSHETGKVRGLLCGNCNRGLGLFSDDITRLQSAVAYLS